MAKFQQYKYDPSDPSTPKQVKKDIPEFNFKCPDIGKLICYTIHVYDPHSDLLKLYSTDLNRRKREAALAAGFKINDNGVFDKWVEDSIVGDNSNYNSAIVAFVTKFNIADLPAFILYREIFFSEFAAAMKATDSKDKKDAMANAETARTRMELLEKKLFTGEETANVRDALYIAAEAHKLNLRPEDKANEIESGTLSVSDPYL